MILLARYVRSARAAVLDLHLLDIESERIVHVITDADAEAANEAMITLGRQWAGGAGHTIAEIDPQILNAS